MSFRESDVYRTLYGWKSVELRGGSAELSAGGAAERLAEMAAELKKLAARYERDADFDALMAAWRKVYRENRVRRVPGVRLVNNGFIKGVEIYRELRRWGLFERDMDAYHLAELPGGFYFAAQYVASKRKVAVRARIQSLRGGSALGDDTCFFESNGLIDYGPRDGDLTSEEERKWLAGRIGPQDLITADGGVDYAARTDLGFLLDLYRGETDVALSCLRPGGVFVIKLYVVFEEAFYEYLCMLHERFKEVRLFKPTYSKPHSFEMYALCRGPRAAVQDAPHAVQVIVPAMEQICKRVLAVYSLYERAVQLSRRTLDEAEALRRRRFLANLNSP